MKCSYFMGTGKKLSSDEYERSDIKLSCYKKKKKSNHLCNTRDYRAAKSRYCYYCDLGVRGGGAVCMHVCSVL
jgi:hypothetical protein